MSKGTVTPKAGDSELWFLCSAQYITVIYICIKFQENISNSFQVTMGNNSKSKLSRVTVLVSCTSSYNALHLCEI